MFLQIKDIKHIKQDFCSDAWVMPQGWDLGAAGVRRGPKSFFSEHGHVAYRINENDETNMMQAKFFTFGSNW